MTASLNSIRLRAATPADEAFLLELYESSRGDDLRGLGWDEKRISEFLEMQYEAQQRFFDSEYKGANDQIILRSLRTAAAPRPRGRQVLPAALAGPHRLLPPAGQPAGPHRPPRRRAEAPARPPRPAVRHARPAP